jgi:hypothetical protein
MSMDARQLAADNASLRTQITTLRLRKPRQDSTAQTMIKSALECLDLIESGKAAKSERDGYFDMIRRVLQAEHDTYTAPADA